MLIEKFYFQNKINNIPKLLNNHYFGIKNTIDNKNLTKDTFTYTTNPISFTGKRVNKNNEKYKDVVNSLKLLNDSAQNSFNEQYKKGGLFAKTVDTISILWNSKNRYELVKNDLDTYTKQIDELSQSIDKGIFPTKFKEIFGIGYNQKNIDKYNESHQRLMLASTTKFMSDSINDKIGKELEIGKSNNGKLNDYSEQKISPYASLGSVPVYTIKTNKKEVFENMEKAITEVVGGKDVLKNMLEAQNLKSDASNEEKYEAYYKIGDFISKTSKMTADRCCKGKTLKELTKEYEEAYENAYGKTNNIQKRVDNYNRSQQIGVSMLKTGVKNPLKLAIIGLIGITNPIAAIPTGVALSFGVDMLEKATSNENKENTLSKESIDELMKDTAISYADYVIETGANAIFPNFTTGNAIINAIISTARKTTIDVSTSMISEYMSTGKWDNKQIAPRALVSAVFGKISPDDELAKSLLSMTENGVKKSLLYDDDEKNSVKQFLNKVQAELQNEYMKNPEVYSLMKSISITNPKAFENMISDLLQEHINNTVEKKNSENKSK